MGDDQAPVFGSSTYDWIMKKGRGEFSADEWLDHLTSTRKVNFKVFGKPATKLGYKLPRPVGVSIVSHLQEQNMQFTDLAIGVNGEDLTSLNDFFILDQSNLTQSTVSTVVRADAWIFPFMNFMVLFSRANNSLDGGLALSDDVRGLLEFLGVEDVPEEIGLNLDITTNIYGGGLTFAGGIGNVNLTLNYQLAFANTPDANTWTTAHVITPLVGYMLPIKMNVMVGCQGQFYNTGISGFIDLDGGDRLDYLVDFEPIRWNFLVGIYKGFAKHWEISLQAGFGGRQSATVLLGYRF